MRGSKCSDQFGLEPFGKILIILENWSLRRGGLLREVVATRGSTALQRTQILYMYCTLLTLVEPC